MLKGGKMGREKRVSSIDVAREAGVSQATVSYVLNNVKGVKIKKETREAVIAAAKKLNYHPNLIARSMRLKKSMSIGIVSDKNVSNFMFMKTLEGIKDALLPRNYSIMMCFDKSHEIEDSEYIKYYSSNRIDGIIFAYANITDEQCAFLVENNIPFVIIHNNIKIDTNNIVRTDMVNAIIEGVKHFQSKGIDRIAYFGGGIGNLNDRRYNGYITAMERCGIPVEDNILLNTAGAEDDIEKCFESYFKGNKNIPGAAFCETTGIGFRFLRYAAKNGIKIPEDIAIIAIGVSMFSSMSYPSLSTIESPVYDMGYTGCEMLFDIMDGKVSNNVVVLEWKFTPRGSS